METVVRVTLIYLAIFGGIRLLGKREFAQLSPLELVSLLLIPEIVQQALVRDDFSLVNALVGLSTLFLLVFGTSVVMHRWKKAETIITERPRLLADHGRLLEDALNHERVTPDEVFSEMRRSGLDRLEQVRWAVLETDGKISIVPEQRVGTPPPDKESL